MSTLKLWAPGKNLPVNDLYKDILADRDRLLEEIASRNARIAEQERCLALAAEMIECLTHIKEGQ
jgi:hypothetical protein